MSKWIFFSFFILYLFYLFICVKQRSRSLRISYSVRWVGCSFDCFVCNCMLFFFASLFTLYYSLLTRITFLHLATSHVAYNHHMPQRLHIHIGHILYTHPHTMYISYTVIRVRWIKYMYAHIFFLHSFSLLDSLFLFFFVCFVQFSCSLYFYSLHFNLS